MKNPFKVNDPYRKNELSFLEGGATVFVKYTNGDIREYDKIKNPHAYVKKVLKNPDVENAWVKPKEKQRYF